MNSIRFRLTVYLLACVLAMSAAGGVAVYLVFRDTMIRQFDDALYAEARSISGFFTRDHDGRYEFKPPPDMNNLYRHGNDLDVYCIRRMDGTVVVHAPWIKPENCPGAERPVSYVGSDRVHGYRSPRPGGDKARHHRGHGEHRWAVPLTRGHGSHWRGAFVSFLPASETRMAVDRFQIAVAAEWEESDDLLKQLLWVLLAVSGAAGAATIGLVVWTVQSGLSPLRVLARQAAGIDAAHLDQRFSLDDAPAELKPIHRALNDLLDRIEASLKREQRFNDDVAHELRTPVAELRSLSEVALAAPDDRDSLAEALRDARDIGAQMEAMITALLALRRREPGTPQRLDIVALIKQVWQASEAAAKARGLAISWEMPREVHADCDRTMLLSVLQNLFQNTVSYTASDGEITCAVAAREREVEIAVSNRPHGLSSDDLPHLCEPFWRKDEARSDGAHVGLGLALAESYCRAMGGALRAEIKDEGWLTFTVTLPRAPES